MQIGITAAAWPLVAGTPAAAGLEPRLTVPLLGVVCDTRFAESVAFGERSAARGLRAYAIAGDMTHLWYDEIYHRWKQGPLAIAGVTAHGPMFCFAELARDVRMRLVYRAEHAGSDPGAVTLYSWIVAPQGQDGITGVAEWLFLRA